MVGQWTCHFKAGMMGCVSHLSAWIRHCCTSLFSLYKHHEHLDHVIGVCKYTSEQVITADLITEGLLGKQHFSYFFDEISSKSKFSSTVRAILAYGNVQFNKFYSRTTS